VVPLVRPGKGGIELAGMQLRRNNWVRFDQRKLWTLQQLPLEMGSFGIFPFHAAAKRRETFSTHLRFGERPRLNAPADRTNHRDPLNYRPPLLSDVHKGVLS
jgi:hypothetical protein